MFQPVFGIDQQGGKGGANYSVDVSPPILSDSHGTPHAVCYGIQGSMIGRADENGPQGDGVNEDVSFTLNTTDRHAVVYGISPYHSNCMKSDNPHSGYYEADTSRSLDAMNCGYPGCNQGGMAVVQPILLESNQNHATIQMDGISTTLPASMGMGGGYVPMVTQPVTFEPGIASREGGHVYADVSGTLRAHAGDNQMAVAYSIENHPADSRVDIDPAGKVQTLTSRMGTGGGNVPMVMEVFHAEVYEDQSPPLKARDYKDPHVVCSETQSAVAHGVDCQNATEYRELNGTLQASCHHNTNSCNVVRVKHIVRRLTPLECERLQGFPDGWTDIGEWVDSKGKRHKEADSPRYKALGNSIALPPWKWVLKRLCGCYERDATMASLFDGIGGFPLIWEQINGKGSCLWSSEIEEFPMAVTKLRFGGNDT